MNKTAQRTASRTAGKFPSFEDSGATEGDLRIQNLSKFVRCPLAIVSPRTRRSVEFAIGSARMPAHGIPARPGSSFPSSRGWLESNSSRMRGFDMEGL